VCVCVCVVLVCACVYVLLIFRLPDILLEKKRLSSSFLFFAVVLIKTRKDGLLFLMVFTATTRFF
jgi:hypothetical protein